MRYLKILAFAFITVVLKAHAQISDADKLNKTKRPSFPSADDALGFRQILMKRIGGAVEFFGYGLECKNGGYKTEENTCICKKYFSGNSCEKKQCINGGQLEKVRTDKIEMICKCPNPKFILGQHCETPTCGNGGKLVTMKDNTWHCDCQDVFFYKGMFCDKPILSIDPIYIGILLVALFIFFGCTCSLTHCKKAQQTYPPNSRRMRYFPTPTSTYENGLLNNAEAVERNTGGMMRRTAAYPEGVVQPYVVRLDTIPTFNPRMIGGVEPTPAANEQHPSGPPPTYDQALSTPHVNPPDYTPMDMAKQT